LTDDAWFGVTPEPVAKFVCPWRVFLLHWGETDTLNSKIAAHLGENAPAGRVILVDCFAGAGGNTIAFAKTGKWKRIYAIEKNPAVLQCAKHNAKIYGVENQITWFEGDCFEILKKQLKDLAPYSVIFASPPWGGKSQQIFFPVIDDSR
jgi:tRNA G37 N-methylase Trm5